MPLKVDILVPNPKNMHVKLNESDKWRAISIQSFIWDYGCINFKMRMWLVLYKWDAICF